jgi:hypothetical protein
MTWCVSIISWIADWASNLNNILSNKNSATRWKNTIHRCQYPMTAAYAFTNYRSQGQTLPYVIVDIGSPLPTGTLSLFNLYVALSRSNQTVAGFQRWPFQSFAWSSVNGWSAEDERLETWTKRQKSGITDVCFRGRYYLLGRIIVIVVMIEKMINGTVFPKERKECVGGFWNLPVEFAIRDSGGQRTFVKQRTFTVTWLHAYYKKSSGFAPTLLSCCFSFRYRGGMFTYRYTPSCLWLIHSLVRFTQLLLLLGHLLSIFKIEAQIYE